MVCSAGSLKGNKGINFSTSNELAGCVGDSGDHLVVCEVEISRAHNYYVVSVSSWFNVHLFAASLFKLSFSTLEFSLAVVRLINFSIFLKQ